MDIYTDTLTTSQQDFDPYTTAAGIDPEVETYFGCLPERRIRMVARMNGIVLTTRVGNKRALLAELSRHLTGRKP